MSYLLEWRYADITMTYAFQWRNEYHGNHWHYFAVYCRVSRAELIDDDSCAYSSNVAGFVKKSLMRIHVT